MERGAFLVAGSANPLLAGAVAAELQASPARVVMQRFPDGEVHVELEESPEGRDVFLLQPTSPRPDECLMELLVLADACRRGDAARVTAVVPYFAYARQDRRARGLESVAARVVADCLAASGVQRVIALDLHTDAIEGFFTIPVERLSAVPLMAEALKKVRPHDGVVVSPDLGAAKLAERYGSLLDLPVAIVHKTRLGPEQVRVSQVTGDVENRTPVVIDDMISTGGTIEAAIRAVVAAGARQEGITVAATHGLFVGDCEAKFRELGIDHLLVTDSVARASTPGLHVEVVSVAGLVARAVQRFASS